MKPFEEQFTAWVDGRLTGADLADFEKQLAAHPDAAAEKESTLRLGQFLRTHDAVPPLRNSDFFNHQLQQRIAAETPRPAVKERAAFWSLSRLAWAGAFCLAVALGLYETIIPARAPLVPESKYFAQVVEAWPADPSISATTVYSSADSVTVVWLDGLDYIPATYALK